MEACDSMVDYVSMDLLIVESPTKARTLAKFLSSKQYSVLPTVGHVRDLPKSKLGVDVENNFAPDWALVKGKRDVLGKIKEEAIKSKRIFLATDPDREGEAIAWHVWELLSKNSNKEISKKPMKRVTFHEITQSAVEHSLNEAHDIDVHLVEAQQARRVVDRLVGYTLSPVLWKKVRRGLSGGRVQSVAVRLVVEREKEREAFVSEEYWDVWVSLSRKSEKTQGEDLGILFTLLKRNNKVLKITNVKESEEVCLDLAVADYKVGSITKKESVSKPPAPFTTSTLQQTAGARFGYSAKRTMAIAQQLYEKGLITYHRTDATNLAVEAVDGVRDFILKNYGEKYLPAKPVLYATKSKVAQEAHEAIRPTMSSRTPETSELEGADLKLYSLIWQRFVGCQMTWAIFDKTDIEVNATVEEDKLVYQLGLSGKVRKFDGWLRASGKYKDDDEIPSLDKDEVLEWLNTWGTQRFTEPIARYSEATLIKTLESLGIGRPSTYASIISTIQDRNYVEKQDGRLKPTAIGQATNDFLVKQFPSELDYQFTARMENDLDEVANGNENWTKLVGSFYTPFVENAKKAESADRVPVPTETTGEKCPTCNEGDVVIRTGRFGKFLSCSRFPECKYTAKFLVKIDMKCPKCEDGDVISRKTKRGRTFYGCSRYPDCDWSAWKLPVEEKEVKDESGE